MTVRASVRAELSADVDAIVTRYAGKARTPVLMADDGALLYVFRPEELSVAGGIMSANLNWSGPGFSFRTDGSDSGSFAADRPTNFKFDRLEANERR